MNKKEVLEIRKQFTPENCSITRIAGCYVDGEKEKRMEREDAFIALPEEQMFKYFDIFKKTLSGKIGKNLLNLEYKLKESRSSDPEGEEHELLMNLRESKLKDPALLDEFYEKILTSYDCAENYYIILIHAVYDVPGKTSDGEELEDASEEVYDFILCCICPVKLSKPGLTYNGKDERMEERIRDWVVGTPDKGFLFPAFNDRQTDVHSLLYYTRKSAEVQEEMVREVLGIDLVVSADEEKDKFGKLVEDVLGEDADCKTVKEIYEGISEEMERHYEDPEPYKMSKNTLKKIFESSGVPDEKIDLFGDAYRENIGDEPIMASNICDNKVVNIRVPEGKIAINTELISNLEIKEVDGRKCMVLPVDSVEVNGIMTKA
mgnify:FL=1